MPATSEQIAKLRAPTPKAEIKKRAGPKGLTLDYVDARYHYDTLDQCVGPENWQSAFERDPKGALRAGIGILTDGGWVWKWDVGTTSDIEPVKGEHSDALKRAGVQWGISRDLYDSTPEASKPGVARVPGPAAAAPVSYATSGWKCPIHGTVRVVPAGVSKKTGRAYPAFEVCAESDCEQKAGRGRGARQPVPVVVAPEPTEWVGMGVDEEDEDFAGVAE